MTDKVSSATAASSSLRFELGRVGGATLRMARRLGWRSMFVSLLWLGEDGFSLSLGGKWGDFVLDSLIAPKPVVNLVCTKRGLGLWSSSRILAGKLIENKGYRIRPKLGGLKDK